MHSMSDIAITSCNIIRCIYTVHGIYCTFTVHRKLMHDTSLYSTNETAALSQRLSPFDIIQLILTA